MISLAGYDPVLVARLAPADRRFFWTVCTLAVLASVVVGVGMGDGAQLAFEGAGPAVVAGLVFGALTLNLYRLLHAGTGYPMHLPIEEIDLWRPGAAPAFVLFGFGTLVTQPLVFLAMRLHDDGIIGRARAAWAHPAPAAALTAALSLVVSAPAWLRILFPSAFRNYERERWIEGRLLVDDAFADAQDAITHLLERVPGFSGTLAVHYADPPYNMKPLVFGLDPALVERGQIKWTKYKEQAPEQVAPAPVKPPEPPPPKAPEPDAEELVASWDDTSHDDDTEAPPIAFFDVGRLQMKRAKEHADVVAPFLAAFTGRPETEVRALLRVSPPDERVHKIFGDYKKLRTILLKNAAFAQQHGLAPVVAIITQRPLADVEKRLRAAPPDRRLTGVFAPELARRLLKKKR